MDAWPWWEEPLSTIQNTYRAEAYGSMVMICSTRPAKTDTVFTLPSKNLSCAMIADAVRCDIVQRSWTPPTRAANCPADHCDFGHGLTDVGSDAASMPAEASGIDSTSEPAH
jgi:hypothetical protein